MKMVRWIQGNTRTDHIINVIVWGKAYIKPINTFLVKKRLTWFGHVQRRDDNVAKSVLNTQIEVSGPGPNLRWMDCVKDDMKLNMTRPDWASDREGAGSI